MKYQPTQKHRLTDEEAMELAERIRPYVSGVIVEKGVISNTDLRNAFQRAHYHEKLPMVSSDRKLDQVERALVEM